MTNDTKAEVMTMQVNRIFALPQGWTVACGVPSRRPQRFSECKIIVDGKDRAIVKMDWRPSHRHDSLEWFAHIQQSLDIDEYLVKAKKVEIRWVRDISAKDAALNGK